MWIETMSYHLAKEIKYSKLHSRFETNASNESSEYKQVTIRIFGGLIESVTKTTEK